MPRVAGIHDGESCSHKDYDLGADGFGVKPREVPIPCWCSGRPVHDGGISCGKGWTLEVKNVLLIFRPANFMSLFALSKGIPLKGLKLPRGQQIVSTN